MEEQESVIIYPILLGIISTIIILIPSLVINSEVNSWDDIVYEKRDCSETETYANILLDEYDECSETHDGPFISLLLCGMASFLLLFGVWASKDGFYDQEEVLPKTKRILIHTTITFSIICSLGAWAIFESRKHIFYDTVDNVTYLDRDAYSTPDLFWCYFLLCLPITSWFLYYAYWSKYIDKDAHK